MKRSNKGKPTTLFQVKCPACGNATFINLDRTFRDHEPGVPWRAGDPLCVNSDRRIAKVRALFGHLGRWEDGEVGDLERDDGYFGFVVRFEPLPCPADHTFFVEVIGLKEGDLIDRTFGIEGFGGCGLEALMDERHV